MSLVPTPCVAKPFSVTLWHYSHLQCCRIHFREAQILAESSKVHTSFNQVEGPDTHVWKEGWSVVYTFSLFHFQLKQRSMGFDIYLIPLVIHNEYSNTSLASMYCFVKGHTVTYTLSKESKNTSVWHLCFADTVIYPRLYKGWLKPNTY